MPCPARYGMACCGMEKKPERGSSADKELERSAAAVDGCYQWSCRSLKQQARSKRMRLRLDVLEGGLVSKKWTYPATFLIGASGATADSAAPQLGALVQQEAAFGGANPERPGPGWGFWTCQQPVQCQVGSLRRAVRARPRGSIFFPVQSHVASTPVLLLLAHIHRPAPKDTTLKLPYSIWTFTPFQIISNSTSSSLSPSL
jgi:hypothetical protein